MFRTLTSFSFFRSAIVLRREIFDFCLFRSVLSLVVCLALSAKFFNFLAELKNFQPRLLLKKRANMLQKEKRGDEQGDSKKEKGNIPETRWLIVVLISSPPSPLSHCLDGLPCFLRPTLLAKAPCFLRCFLYLMPLSASRPSVFIVRRFDAGSSKLLLGREPKLQKNNEKTDRGQPEETAGTRKHTSDQLVDCCFSRHCHVALRSRQDR